MSEMEFGVPSPALEATLEIAVTTHSSTLAATAPTSAPTFTVYSADGTTSVYSGTTTLFASTTGCYLASIPCTSGNGFQAGSHYKVLFSYAISGTNYKKVAHFSVA